MDELTRLRAENEAMREYGRQIRAKDQAGYMSRKQMRTCIAALTAERDQLAKAAQDAEYSGPLAYYIPLVERLEADNAALRAALAAAQEWTPVEKGVYDLRSEDFWDLITIYRSGTVAISRPGDDGDVECALFTLPEGFAICAPKGGATCGARAPAQEDTPNA